MISSNTSKVLSYKDVDELNQQVVERPVTNSLAPCDQDVEESAPSNWIKVKFVLLVLGLFVTSYVKLFLFWPAICALIFVNSICEYIYDGRELSEETKGKSGLCFCFFNVFPGLFALIGFVILPYTITYSVVVSVATMIYMYYRVRKEKGRAAKDAELLKEFTYTLHSILRDTSNTFFMMSETNQFSVPVPSDIDQDNNRFEILRVQIIAKLLCSGIIEIKYEDEDLINEFKSCLGQFLKPRRICGFESSQNEEHLAKKLKILLMKLMTKGRIPRKEGHDIIAFYSSCGY